MIAAFRGGLVMAARWPWRRRDASYARHMELTRRQVLAAAALPMLGGFAAQREYEVPFVPTPHALVQRMLDLGEVGAADYLIDLGCGDGRIAVAAARRGARALGVDLDPLRIQEAAAAARIAGRRGANPLPPPGFVPHPDLRGQRRHPLSAPRDQPAPPPAPAHRASPRRANRQPRLRHGRLARRGRGDARRPPHLPVDRAGGGGRALGADRGRRRPASRWRSSSAIRK